MNKLLIVAFFQVCFFLPPTDCMSQEKKKKPDDPEAYFPTENINSKFSDDNTRENIPKKKIYSVIYKYKLEGTLYGNPCALEETQRMGFIYVVQPKGFLPTNRPWPLVWVNNLWVNTKLIFTRSPFWKSILKKRIDACRDKSGDMVG